MKDRFVSWKTLPRGEKQDAQIIFRCTQEQKRLIDLFAGQDRTRSDVIRAALQHVGIFPPD